MGQFLGGIDGKGARQISRIFFLRKKKLEDPKSTAAKKKKKNGGETEKLEKFSINIKAMENKIGENEEKIIWWKKVENN